MPGDDEAFPVKSLTFEVAGVAVPQPRHRAAVGKNGKAHVYLPSKHEVAAFKHEVAIRCHMARPSGWQPMTGAVLLRIIFLMERPQRLIWKRKEMVRLPASVKPDLDNLVKSVKDAMSGTAWDDDARVCILEAQKWYAAAFEKPCVLIYTEEMTPCESKPRP